MGKQEIAEVQSGREDEIRVGARSQFCNVGVLTELSRNRTGAPRSPERTWAENDVAEIRESAFA